MTNSRSGNSTMSSDRDRQPKSKPKKRRHIVVSETDSSDECDSPTTKNRRKQRMNKLRSDIKKMTKETKAEVEASCSTHSVNDDKPSSEKRVNGKRSSDVSDGEIVPNNETVSSQTVKSPKNPEKNEDTIVASLESSDKDKKNENTQGVDKCPICWTPFEHQEIAIPVSCDHRFCFECIMKWSKHTNTCPVDRLEFNDIAVRPNISSKPTLYVPTPRRIQRNDTDDDDLSQYILAAINPYDVPSTLQEDSDSMITPYSMDDDEDEEEEGEEEQRHSVSTNDFDDNDVDPESEDLNEGQEEEDRQSSSTNGNEFSSSPTNHDDTSLEDVFLRSSSSDNEYLAQYMRDRPITPPSPDYSYHGSPSDRLSDSPSPGTSFLSSPSSITTSSSSSLSYSS